MGKKGRALCPPLESCCGTESGEHADGLGGAGDHVVAVELGDVVHGDTFRASGFALILVGAVAEAEGVHLTHHGEHALVLLRVALRQQIEVRSLGGGEEHGGAVFAAGHASAATDACGCVESGIRRLLAHGHIVGVRRRAGTNIHKAAGGDDLVQSRAIDNEIAQQRESLGAERFNPDRVAILELAHVQLAGRHLLAAVGHTVDGERAHTADALAAVVVEMDGLLAFVDEFFIHDIEHLEERSFVRDVLCLVGFDAALGLSIFLPPDLERKIESSHNVVRC